MEADRRVLIFTNGYEIYIFTYCLGNEYSLLEAITEQAENQQTDFSYEDASFMFYALIESLCREADEVSGSFGN